MLGIGIAFDTFLPSADAFGGAISALKLSCDGPNSFARTLQAVVWHGRNYRRNWRDRVA
jgi:hypothetical protein